jgi:hypothetical protein
MNIQNKEITKVTARFSLSSEIIITNLEKISMSFQDQNIHFRKYVNEYEKIQTILSNNLPFFVEIIKKISEYSEKHNIEDSSDLNKIPIWDILKEIPDPQISVINENEEYVNELEITINSNDDQIALFLATRKAQLICNKLSFRSKTAIIPKLRGYLITYNDNTSNVLGTHGFRVVDDIKIQLTKNELSNIESNTLNDSYEHYSRGILALDQNNDPVTAIRDFYQIIEKNKNKFEKTGLGIKYKPLRDTLSHGTTIRKETQKSLKKEFGNQFEFTDRGTFDYALAKNISNLFYHSKILKEKVFQILSGR